MYGAQYGASYRSGVAYDSPRLRLRYGLAIVWGDRSDAAQATARIEDTTAENPAAFRECKISRSGDVADTVSGRIR